MAVLDEVPRSATATAAEETEVLRIGSEEFYEILHEQVEIAEGVIRMLTRRLREADVAVAERAVRYRHVRHPGMPARRNASSSVVARQSTFATPRRPRPGALRASHASTLDLPHDATPPKTRILTRRG